MRKLLLLLFAIIFAGCSKDDNSIVDEIEVQKDKYYVKYVAHYCSYHSHYINYRDEKGTLIKVPISADTRDFSVEVGPVSSIFQAYMEGDYCNYIGPAISIYVKKNNQDYLQMATTTVRSTQHTNATKSLTFNLRDYD